MKAERNNGFVYDEGSAKPTVTRKGDPTITVSGTYHADPSYTATETIHLSLAAAAGLYFDLAAALEHHWESA